MGCIKLLQGLDLACQASSSRFYQQLILINRSDVDQKIIQDTNTLHRVSFNLLPGKTGYLFTGNEAGSIFAGTFSKSKEKGIPYYQHQLQLPVSGTSEQIKSIIKQIDAADFFAAIQLTNGTVEIYGFENGLTTDNYTYEPQSTIGGAIIPISSRDLETGPPYIYDATGAENAHFNSLFAGTGDIIGGDFNSDFNNDFDNIELP